MIAAVKARPSVREVSRERAALLACADLIEQVSDDLDSLALALACIRGEVHDALCGPVVGEPVVVLFLSERCPECGQPPLTRGWVEGEDALCNHPCHDRVRP
jgi:hypothetical protein